MKRSTSRLFNLSTRACAVATLWAVIAASVRASHVAETMTLSKGWNAIYLESTPENPACDDFFGKMLQFGDHQFSSSDYATKIDSVGVDLVGLDRFEGGAGVEPNIYLVPVGLDYMRSPAGTQRALLSWNVVDQVLPLPYTVGSDELDATDWISTFSGLDGTSDATATIRRHSTLRAGADFKSTRLVGRSAWNDRWLIVIPASAIDADRDKAMNLIESGVKDIRLGVRAYARSGN